MKHVVFLIIGFWIATSSVSWAGENFSLDDSHGGVVEQGEYQIFPRMRLGNGLYYHQNRLVNLPDRMILEVVPVPDSRNVVYLYQDINQKLSLALYGETPGREFILKTYDADVYEVLEPATQLAKLYRIFDGKILPLLPDLRKPRGVTVSENYIIFYHITSTDKKKNTEKNYQKKYRFQLHISKRDQPVVSTMDAKIVDTRSFLSLHWESPGVVRYELENGEKHNLILDTIKKESP